MEKRYLTCIGCPMGCALTVNLSGQKVVSVEGNTCKKGKIYGEQEVISPVRTVTTTVAVEGGKLPAVSVKTKTDIPKEKIFDCVRALKGIRVLSPVRMGQTILCNVAETGVDIVATKTVEAR